MTIPVGLPSIFGIGLKSGSTGTTDLAWMTGSGVPWSYRYQYFATTTTNAPGVYVSDSLSNNYIPVITRYTTLNSSFSLASLANTATMNAYYADFVAQVKSMVGWNLWYAQKSGSTSVTISTDCTTATYTGTTGTDNPTISGNFHGTGKWVVRFNIVVDADATHMQIGIGTRGTIFGSFLGSSTGSLGIASGGMAINNVFFVSTAAAAPLVTGDVVDLAVDFDNKLLWVRTNSGNWNGNAGFSPGGTGGASIASLSFPNVFAPAANFHTLNDQVTFGTPPTIAGFSAWNSAPASTPMIMHLEPDLWGFMQQQGGPSGAQTDDPSTVVVSVASSGFAGLGSLPNTAIGFAQALKQLRDANAPGVYLAWHCSTWGPNDGFVATNASFTETPAATGGRVANFYNALATNFDLIFHDTSTGDRDADFGILVNSAGLAATAAVWWWTATAFSNYQALLAAFHQALSNPTSGLLWQMAQGNTLYRSLNDTSFHYQDNKVEFFLTAGAGVAQGSIYDASAIANFASAGIIGMLFGQGLANCTDNYDNAGDGITNPTSITNQNGMATNTRTATVSDDDGGFFKLAAAVYYASPLNLLPPIQTFCFYSVF